MNKKGFTLIELLVVIVIIGILVAIALPNFIKIKDKAKEAEVKQNCHAIQLSLERYAVDSPGECYPMFVMGGDWTDSYVVWQYWVDLQGLDPDMITNPERGGPNWLPAGSDVGDTMVMEAYMPSYPENPFQKNKGESITPRIHHYPHPAAGSPVWRIVGGRESNKMYECFGPDVLIFGGAQTLCGDWCVHHIFNNPPYDFEGDINKEPENGWVKASGNRVLVGNFAYFPRCQERSAFTLTSAGDPVGYTLAGYGAVRTKGQDVYNRNGNFKGRCRTEPCQTDCRSGTDVFPDDVPCICEGNGNAGSPPSIVANNGGSDTVPDGVVITLDSGTDKKSQKVDLENTEGEGEA